MGAESLACLQEHLSKGKRLLLEAAKEVSAVTNEPEERGSFLTLGLLCIVKILTYYNRDIVADLTKLHEIFSFTSHACYFLSSLPLGAGILLLNTRLSVKALSFPAF